MSKIKIYKASAGSGKTYTLALEYIRELLTASSGETYRNILAVTFTRDATSEMKDRILAELYGLALETEDSAGFKDSLKDALKEAGYPLSDKQIQEKSARTLQAVLHDYSRLNITTIDGFFQKVLRNLARELGRGSKFNLEMNTGRVLQEAVQATIEKAGQNKQVFAWLTAYIERKMEDDRSWRVGQDLLKFSQCIYNEFFQENEKKLRRQLGENPGIFAELSQRQYAVQADCKQAFKRIMQRMNALLDFHALGSEDFGNSKYGLQFITKLGNGDTAVIPGVFVEKCRSEGSFWGKSRHVRKAEIEELAATDLMPLLTEAIETLAVYKTSRMITGNLHQLGLIWDIDREIMAQNTENNRFMLSDTARFLYDMIDGSDAPFVYEKIGAEIHHVMIDEFQDTSRLQWENFHALLSNILANDSFSLIVGDVKQSIYRWRNGDWRILNDVGKRLNAVTRTLEYNYRSEKKIIEFNNAFFISAAAVLNALHELKFGKEELSPLLSTYKEENVRQQTKKQTDDGYVSVGFIADKEEERSYSELMQEAVFRQLRQLYEADIPAGDICILTRKNQEIIVLADYLASLGEEYPEMAAKNYLRVVSDEAFQLKSSLAVRMIIEALRVIADSGNVIADAVLREWRVRQNLATGLDEREELQKMPLFELVGHLYRTLELKRIEGQSSYLFAFYDYLAKYLNEQASDLPAFLQYWDDELNSKAVSAGSGVSGIRAMTIHKSKGLQFPTVIIPYCDWSINPKPNSTIVWCGPKENWYDVALLPVAYTNAMAETTFAGEYREETSQSWVDNLNLLYVAFTRAERNLMLLAKYKSSLKGEEQIAAVSDLLQLIVPQLTGSWDEEIKYFETGSLSRSPLPALHSPLSANPLKQTPPPRAMKFVSEAFQADKFMFRQSNKSREFVAAKPAQALYGNIMHSLFEQIAGFDTIEKAVDNLIADGLLRPDEKPEYLAGIHSAIHESGVENWFDGRYRSYQEHSIITEENSEIVNKRPDRVLLSEGETIVVDYKFGVAHSFHKKQVRQYMDLLETMHYPNVKGYLWYVEERKVEEIE
ncbi:MAG: UvrD-helicase domain-containing protein [Dysgonamonadaceae bacterium]|jgi:ATP-dependent exoDNAse (exonuclease V) beta subunit|nr:UvrD-helicase domain-containing protein [Dysgonamonadaceae bacterium]